MDNTEELAEPVKRCRLCLEEKPTSEFSKHKNTKDRLRHECKKCRSAESAQQLERVQNSRTILPETAHKTCIKCGKEKLVTEFSKRKDSYDGYRNDCKACAAVREKDRIIDPERKREISRRSYAKNAQARAHYYQENRERINERKKRYHAANRELAAERMKKWRQNNPNWWKENHKKKPHLNAENVQRRQARKKAAYVEDVKRAVQLERYEYRCALCYKNIKDEQDWQLDHIIPLSKGGAHSYLNTQVLCTLCNQRKNKFLADELAERGFNPLLTPGQYYSDDLEPSKVDELPDIVFPDSVEEE